MKKSLELFISLILFILILLGIFCYLEFKKTIAIIPYPQGQKIISIPDGTSFNQAITLLTQSQQLRKNWPYKLYFHLNPKLATIQAGDYLITNQMTVIEALRAMHDGAVIIFKFTLIEGQTFTDLMLDLSKSDIVEHTLIGKTNHEIAELLGIEGNPEGWFLPQTYNFSKGTTDLEILQRLHQQMQDTLSDIWENRQSDIAIKSPYDALILASIIEKETGINDERQKISGVFNNRLKKNMRLQTDPTVMYGMNQSRSPLKLSDLRHDTPYNTYTRYGLPPTPISMPGKASLIAAVHPDNSKALFFVADGKGGHTFTNTYKEHLKAVKIYRHRNK